MSPLRKMIVDRELLVEIKGKFPEKVRPVRRSFLPVGVRNPYAVFKAVTKTNPPFREMTPEEVQEKLANTIGHKLEYHQLFDPRWGSCLFCQKTIDAVRPEHVVIEAKADSVIYSDVNSYQSEETPESGSGTQTAGATPQPFADCAYKLAHSTWTVKSQTDPEDPKSMIFRWFDKNTSGNFPDKISPAYDEIAQGPIPDCYFLAALSSLAWFYALYPSANPSGKIVADPVNQIPFWAADSTKVSVGGNNSTAPGTDYRFVHTDYTLPLDSGGIPAGALSEPSVVSWVAFYEKAFVRYLEYIQKITPPSSDNRYPNICRIPCGSSGETLRALCQVSSGNLSYHDTTTRKKPNEAPVATAWNTTTVWETIKTCTCETGVFIAGKSLKTKCPVVAETYCTGDPTLPPGIPNPPICAAPAGSGVAYTDDLIVASHAYSLLGIHKGKDSKSYVLLRNPYGENWGFLFGQQSYGLLGQSAADMQLEFTSIKVGIIPYKRALFKERTLPDGTVNKTPIGGVFGLLLDDFVKYFRCIYWVVR